MGHVAPSAIASWDLAAHVRAALAPLVAEHRQLQVQLRSTERERDRWRRRAEALEKQTDRLKAELEEARRAAKRQAAPFARRRRKNDPKRPGRKAGHPAAMRPAPPAYDDEIQVPLCTCPDCGGPVTAILDLAPQTVVDVPEPIRPVVRRYHNQSGWCARCHRRVRSRHPDQCSLANGAAGVQIGPRALSLGVDLKHRVGVSFRKVRGIFQLFFGLVVSAGALVRAERRIRARLVPTYQALVQVVRQAEVVHCDETGWYVTWAQRRAWLWVFTAPTLGITLFAIRLSRGSDVVRDILGPDFQGVLGVDGWAAYLSYACRKGQCSGHLLRRCTELLEVQKQGAARFAHAVRRVLRAGMALKELQGLLPPADYAACAEQVRAEMTHLLAGDIQEPANRRFAQHLRRHQDEIFTYLDVPALEPTNNPAEQELRPGVIVRKLSAGNRTLAGARDHEVLATCSRTSERHGQLLPELLPALLRSPHTYVLPILPPQLLLPAPPEAEDHGPRPEPRARPVPTHRHRHLRRDRRPTRREDGAAPRAPP